VTPSAARVEAADVTAGNRRGFALKAGSRQMADMTQDPPTAPGAEAPGARRRRVLNTATEILINVVLPFAIFSLGKARLGEAGALMVSSAPPILWSLIEFARKRRIDALSVLVLTASRSRCWPSSAAAGCAFCSCASGW
jgi:hypothetical protein